jgi:predicted RNA-binding Zn ribbon-like protein
MANPAKELSPPTEKVYQLVGGALCLDFCNTVGGKREGIAHENLHTYEDLVRWCEQAGITNSEQGRLLKKKAIEDPVQATKVLTRALRLREAIYVIFYAVLNGNLPPTREIGLLNAELGLTLGRLRVQGQKDGSFQWIWSGANLMLDYPLGPVAYSAANLLVSGHECEQLRQCGGENCGWLFIDSSKNHSRRWCDMRDCGNRAKVRRHRQKQRHS